MVIRHLLWLAALIISPLWAGQISLPSHPIGINERFEITISADGHWPIDALSMRNKPAFLTIENTIHQQFNQPARTLWIISMQSEQGGDLLLDGFAIAGTAIPPTRLFIDDINYSSDRISLDFELGDEPFYAGERRMTTATLRWHGELLGGDLVWPMIDDRNGHIEGDDVTTQQRDAQGNDWQQLNRRFSLNFLSPGVHQLTTPAFEGTMRRVVSQYGQLMYRQERIQLAPETREITVVQPIDLDGTELPPSSALRIDASFADANQPWSVGTPRSLTIIIDAAGTDSSAIPLPQWQPDENWRIFADAPIRRDVFDGTLSHGQLELKYALIPLNTKATALPNLGMRWFNIRQPRTETSEWKAPEIQVVEAAGSTNNNAITSAVNLNSRSNYWPWISAALALCWLLTLSALVYRQRRQKSKKVPVATIDADSALGAYQQLLNIAAKHELTAEQLFLDDEWQQQLSQLRHHCFVDQQSHCDLKAIQKRLRQLPAVQEAKTELSLNP